MILKDNMSIQSCVYGIRNVMNWKIYIGSTGHYINRRRLHLKSLSENRHHSIALQRAWIKYGAEAFQFEILEPVEDKTMLIQIEQKWLDTLKPFIESNGYNICSIAGSPRGVKRSSEFCERNAQLKKGNTNCIGRKYSRLTLEKIARSKRGKKLSPEHRAKLSVAFSGERNPMFGRKRTQHEKNIIGRGVKQYWKIEAASEEKERIVNLIKQYWKEGRYAKRRKATPEERRKISMGLRRVWAARRIAKEVPDPA